MKKYILETYRLLVELKNEKCVPERHEKDLERCIRNLEESIEKKKFNLNIGIIGLIAAIFKSFIDPP
jgi:hypothetical protein